MAGLAMVAGEASGDLLAGLLLRGLRQRMPDVRSYGIGGPRMIAEGFEAQWPSAKLAVRGYAEVIAHLPELLVLRRRLGNALIQSPPQAFIGIDAPDFNLELEVRLRRAGVPVMHFVSPSIWAWRGERIKKIARAVDHMLVLFPFEEAIYRQAGIAATYVGHPLADEIPLQASRADARQALGLALHQPAIALMPGSRLAEIQYNGPTFIAAARLLAQQVPGLQVVAPMASAEARARLLALPGAHSDHAFTLTVLDGQSHQSLAACDAALIASGTATLEAALFKRPMVVAYRMAELSYRLMKNKGYLPWIALPNILAREFLVPEFLQAAATPAALSDALRFQLEDDANRQRLSVAFSAMHDALRCDTAQRSAEVIARFLADRGVCV